MTVYFTKTFEEMGIHYQVLRTMEEAADWSSCSYFLIRSVYYEQIEEDVLQKIEAEKIILVLNIGEEVKKRTKQLRHISLPLFCFQIINVLNKDSIPYAYVKSEYGTEQIKPLSFASVLIVDDNETNLFVAQGLMSVYKMEIDTASSGYDALVLVKKKKYDLIFMDHMMPELDGIDTTKRIREMDGEYYKKVPIVALTANAMSGARESFIKEGFDDFLAKPIEYKELDRILKEFVLPHAPKGYMEAVRQLEDTGGSKDTDHLSMAAVKGQMEDIHMKEKVQSFGGNVQLYMNVLKTYYKDITGRKAELMELYNQKNLKGFTINVHALKSASYNVGADKLGKMAELLEHAGKEKDINWITNNSSELFAQLDKTIETVHDFLEENKTVKVNNPKKERNVLTKEYLKIIKEYCEDMDFTQLEEELCHMKNCSYGEEQERFVKSLTLAYEEFEYEKMTELIDKYLEDKGGE